MPRQPSSCRARPSFGIGGGGCETKSVRPELTDMHSTKCTTVVGCTHTIVRFQTRIRRNDGTESFGGFVYVLDGFPQRDFGGVIMTHMWVSFIGHTGDNRDPSPGFHPLVYAYRTQHAPLFEVAKKAGFRAL